ncbi:putative ribonuclease H-like domain-containing protein [Tanacetum coccineum]
MDLESTQNNALAKLPLLKQGDYDTWRLRIESYIQLQDYALWEIIEDGNSFKPVARTTTNADGTSTSTIPGAVTAEEKIQKKNDLKARSILMMTLPSEHLLTFNQYKDAKTLFEAIEARFGGNEATKKTQKTLLKQMYENFNASSSESLDSIFTRLQKIVSQLAILGENISQEDLNFKFLRSLPSEWSMHVVVWRNKPDLGSISFDDLYNNFKIVEQEVKRSVTSSSNSNSQNVAFVSTPSSTNDVNTSNVLVNTASSSLSTASSTDNTARLSDATIYAFLANQPNGSQVVHEDLEQIHEDDLEEMDLKWQLALLSMKARKFYQRTGKKIIINGSDTAGYDKTKVECFNCHKMGHFARECRNPRSQENRSRNQDSSRRTMNVEESSSKSMLAIDRPGVYWSYMTEDEVPTNFALMAFSYSDVLNNKTCSKTRLKSFEDLKSQYDNLRIELNKSKSDLANYKIGLASVEEQLVFYKKNEGMLCDQIAVFKRDASFNESEINALKIQIERLKKEKESNQIKIDNFENASKSLDKLIGSQISDNNRNGVGYNVVAPPPTGLFTPPTNDLSNSGLEEFKQPEFEGYEVKVNKSVCENSSNEIKKTFGAPIIEDWVFDYDEDETIEKVSESANIQTPKQADQPRKVSQNPRNNSTNWNTPMSKKLGVGFQFTLKACFVCGSFNHLIKDYDFHNKKMVQKPVLNNEKKGIGQRQVRLSGLVPISAARQSSSRAAASVSTVRPIKTVAPKPFANSINTTKGKRVTSVVGEQGIDVVRSKAYWVWRPKLKVLDHDSKNSGSYICKQFDYVDPTGRIKHQELASPEQMVSGKDFSNPLIVDSLLKTIWFINAPCFRNKALAILGQTETVNDGEQQITVTVDGHKFAITEASVKRHLQLADVDDLSSLPNTKIFEQLSQMGVISLETKLKKTKEVHGKALTKLVKKGRMEETEYADVEEENAGVEYDFDLTKQQVTPLKTPQVEEQSQETFKAELSVLSISYDQARPIFEEEYKKVHTLFKKDSEVNKSEKKRVAEESLLQESFKKLRTAQALGSEPFHQEKSTEEPKELSEEDLEKMLEIVQVEEFRVEALQTKYPIIDWEIRTERSRKYWKIIRVGNITEAYQGFEDMLKAFDREDLDTLWSLIKEKFRSVAPTEDMERALRVELKRIYEPDKEDTLWKLQRYMHDPLTWRLYGSCAVHHVFSTRGHCIYMLLEKDYPLTTAVMMLMLSRRLQVEEDSEMARNLVKKIFIEANRSRS